MLDWLKNFDLKRWWIALIAVGLVIVIASVAAKDRNIAVGIAGVGLGIVACGFGEWMNHRMEMEFVKGGTLTTFPRINRPLGFALDALGIILIVTGLYRLFAS